MTGGPRPSGPGGRAWALPTLAVVTLAQLAPALAGGCPPQPPLAQARSTRDDSLVTRRGCNPPQRPTPYEPETPQGRAGVFRFGGTEIRIGGRVQMDYGGRR